jgi:hypothetical protein
LPRVVRIREGKVIFWLKPDAVEAAKGLGRNLDDVVAGAASPVVETLRSPETDVYIDANPEWTIEGIGVGGRTHPSTGRVVINIDPGFDDPDSLFDIWLPRTIAHELHHSKRINDGPGDGKKIEQAVVTEGLGLSSRKKFSPARRHLGPQRSVKVKRAERCRSFGQMARPRIPVERTWNGFRYRQLASLGRVHDRISHRSPLCAQKRSLQARLPPHPRRQSCAGIVTTNGCTPRLLEMAVVVAILCAKLRRNALGRGL